MKENAENLHSVIIDECQRAICNKNFCQTFMNFGTITKMLQGRCPMTLLTATLPRINEPLLLEAESRLGGQCVMLCSRCGSAVMRFNLF